VTEVTRTEFLGRTIHDALSAARDVRTLVPVTAIDPTELDLLDARVAIAEAINALSNAAKDLDSQILNEFPGHTRQSAEWVVMADQKPFEKRTYKGDPHKMVFTVANRIMQQMGWEIEQEEDNDFDAAQDVRDVVAELIKVWTVTRSRMPTMSGLKSLGIDPADHLITDWGDKGKVTVMPAEMYDTVIGPPPLLHSERMPAHSEPF